VLKEDFIQPNYLSSILFSSFLIEAMPMDRLLSSSPLHTNLRPFTRFHSPRFNLFSPKPSSFTSISSHHHENASFPLSGSVPKTLPPLISSQPIPSQTSTPQSQPLNQITTGNDSQKPKVCALCSYDCCSDLVCISCCLHLILCSFLIQL